MSDSPVALFGALVQKYRLAMEAGVWTQDALATEINRRFENLRIHHTKISRIENGRVIHLEPEEVRALVEVLHIPIEELPLPLLWPEAEAALRREGKLPKETAPEHLVAQVDGPDTSREIDYGELNRALLAHGLRVLRASLWLRLSRSPANSYKARLSACLDWLERWMGPSFSPRGFGACLTFSAIYIVLAGIAGFSGGAGGFGDVAIFQAPEWAEGVPRSSLAFFVAVILLTSGTAAYLCASEEMTALVREARSPPSPRWWRHKEIRVGLAGGIAGAGALLASVFGAEAIAVAGTLAIAGFGAVSLRGTAGAMRAGIAGGVIAGCVAGALSDHGLLSGLAVGLVIGFVTGVTAGFVSGKAAESVRTDVRHAKAIAAAGAGTSVGAICVVLLVEGLDRLVGVTQFDSSLAIQIPAVFLVMWLAFPLANALMDYLSLGFSQKLGHFVLHGTHSTGSAILIGFVDALIAVALVATTAMGVAASMALVDHYSESNLLPLEFIRKSADDPFGHGLWATIMVLSTTFWTLAHVVLIVAPTVAARFLAVRLYPFLKRRVRSARSPELILWLVVSGLILCLEPVLVVLISLATVYGLYSVVTLFAAHALNVFQVVTEESGVVRIIELLAEWSLGTTQHLLELLPA